MKEKEGYVSIPTEWKSPSILASVNIDPTRYSHLLIYQDYCQIVVGHVTSPSLDKSDAAIILKELKGLISSFGSTKSRLSAVKYTPTTIRIGQCTLLGKPGYDGLARALELYVSDGPYPKNIPYTNKIDSGSEIIVKERVGEVSLHSWWDFKRYSFGSSLLLTIYGPYEIFSFGFNDKTTIDKLAEAVKCIIKTDIREIKIDTKPEWPDELNLRVFKQSVCGEPAVCISTDTIMGNRRSLIFIGRESGARFLEFLKKAKRLTDK